MFLLVDTIQRDSSIGFPMFGNFSINPPSYFSIGNFHVYFYGVIIACAFLLAITHCARKAPLYGIKGDDVYDTMLWTIPIGIVGARLYYVLFMLDYYLANPGEILAIHNGGLAIYGGIIAGVITICLVCRHKKIKFLAMLDLIISGLLIGQILGRWGNFINREAFGAETDIFCRMALTTTDGSTIYVHPTFLYESLWNLCCFIFLTIWTKRGHRKYDGQNALIYFFWYGIGRTWIEGLRTDSLYIGSTGIRVSQLLSILLAVIAGLLLLVNSRRLHPAEQLYVNQVKKKEAEKATCSVGAAPADESAETSETAPAEESAPVTESKEEEASKTALVLDSTETPVKGSEPDAPVEPCEDEKPTDSNK